MKLSITFAAPIGLTLCWLVGTAAAVPPPGPPSPSTWHALSDQAVDVPRRFVPKHQGIFNGKTVKYLASVAETIVKSPEGTPAASAFTLAFTATDIKEPTSRPVLFIYNGGPGCASSGLFLGAFGPKRMTSLSSAAMADPNSPSRSTR